MKYETLTEFKSDVSLGSGGTTTFTFTFVNNISHLPCVFFRSAGGNSTYRTYSNFTITSISFEDNELTVVATNMYSSASVEDLFLLVTAASY